MVPSSITYWGSAEKAMRERWQTGEPANCPGGKEGRRGMFGDHHHAARLGAEESTPHFNDAPRRNGASWYVKRAGLPIEQI